MVDDTDTVRTISAKKLINKYDKSVYELNRFEYNSLKSSIAYKGIQTPVVINQNNVILDGHHRVRVCRELSIENVPVLVKSFDSKLDEQAFVIFANLIVQKAELFMKLAKIESDRTRQRQRQGYKDQLAPNDAKGKTSEIIARQAGLSPRTYERAVFVIKHADPKTKERLRCGNLSISKSYNYYQRLQKRKKLQEEVTAANISDKANIKLILGDFREKCTEIADNSIALIFTDPPYNKDNLPLYESLGKVAARVLVEGGSLVTFFGQQYLRRVYDSLESAGLNYNWMFAVNHSGGTTSMHNQRVRVTWKPMFWFVKGLKLRTPDYIEDSISSQPPDKLAHDWAQSSIEAEHIISKLTVERDTILDTFMGSGITGIASLKLNRKFIGIEVDESRYNTARGDIEAHRRK